MIFWFEIIRFILIWLQRLASASLLVFANKQDLAGAMSTEEIETVSHHFGQTHSLLSVSFFFLNSVVEILIQ